MEIVSSRAEHLWDALWRAYEVLGFDDAAWGDEVFGDLVLAKIIEPTSKYDSLRVLAEAGVDPVSYRTVTRRLPVFAKDTFRQALSAACAAHAGPGPASLVLYVKRNRYIKLTGATKSVNRDLEAKARALAGLNPVVTSG